MSRLFVRSIALAALAALGTLGATGASRGALAPAASAKVGPPWISIEYPVNPWDRTTRGAYLLVHAFHHGTPVGYPVRGTAEGIVAGQRRHVALRFEQTSREGVYALRRQWDSAGVWTLVIGVEQGPDDVAQALVELGTDGRIAAVSVPTRRQRDQDFPRRVGSDEIERALQARAARLASGR